VALAALATACSKQDESLTAGQRLDSAVAEAKADAKASREQAQVKLEHASEAVSDAAIVAALNAKIAQDKDLDSSKIDVDIKEGAVVLRGTAPSEAAVFRAVALADGTQGVHSVKSEIKVVKS